MGVDPASDDLSGLALSQDMHSRTLTRTAPYIATLTCAPLVRHFRPLVVAAGHVYALYRIDVGKDVHYLDEAEKQGVLTGLKPRRNAGKHTFSASVSFG
jgi:topoisomerase-4 subunit B